MTVWYNEPKDGFSKIGALVDAPEGVNTRVDFSEAVFKVNPTEKTIDCYIYATAISDIKKSGENSWKFEPQPIYLQLHSEKYEKNLGKGKTATVEPRPFTQWLYKHLSERTTDGFLSASGFIYFNEPMNTTTATMILSGKDAKGKDLTPEMTEFFGSQCFSFEATTLEKLNPATLPDLGSKGGKGGYGGGYAKGQTELERLNDRWEFTKKVTGCDVKDIHELTEACKGMYGQSYPDVLEMLKALTA